MKNFQEIMKKAKSAGPKRIAVSCAHDEDVLKSVDMANVEGIANATLVGNKEEIVKICTNLGININKYDIIDEKDNVEASKIAAKLVSDGNADILMKGLVNTDIILRAILDKEKGLLPHGNVLTYNAALEIPGYHKLVFFSDPAVIPSPDLRQRTAMIKYAIASAHKFGIEKPKVALIHATEVANPKIHYMQDYLDIMDEWRKGEFGNVIIDGPLDVRTACEQASGDIKGIVSPINGQADVLIFPNIESGNAFYKSVSLFAQAEMAGLLQGPICPVVLPSRSDSGLSKYYSMAMACLQVSGDCECRKQINQVPNNS